MRIHYQILSFLLFVGFLAGCSSGTPEAIEEQTTFATYSFQAEADGIAITGRLALDILDRGPERLFTGALTLEDGTRLLSSGSIRGNLMSVHFLGDNIESLGAKTLVIYGWGALEGDDSYAGDFIAEVVPMSEEDSGEEVVLAEGTRGATPTSRGNEPGDDSAGGETGGGETGEEPDGPDLYILDAQLDGNSSLSGELALYKTTGSDGVHSGFWTLEDGNQIGATVTIRNERAELILFDDALEVKVVGSGEVGDGGLLTGSYEGEVFGERITEGSWTALPILSEGGQDETPPTSPSDEDEVPDAMPFTFVGEYNQGGETLEGELEITREPTGTDGDTQLFGAVLTLPQGGARIPGSAKIAFRSVELDLAEEELGIAITGRGHIGGDGKLVLSGSFEGTLFSTAVTDGRWTATQVLPDDEPGDDPAPPSDPGDGETEPGMVRVNISVVSGGMSGNVTVERVLEGGESEIVASNGFVSSGQGSSALQTIGQTL